MSQKRLNFWLPEELIKQLKARGKMSEAVREGMSRYYAMLDWERRQLQDKLTAEELSLLADICNGAAFTSGMIPLGLLADAEDAEPAYYEKWKVDRKALLKKLDSLTACQEAALVDAIERFWEAVVHVPNMNPGELLPSMLAGLI